MFIIKLQYSGYLVSGPRKNKKEGCTYTTDRLDYAVKQFKTSEEATQFLKAIKARQMGWGWPAYRIAKGFACQQ